jgi:hypothetical protein
VADGDGSADESVGLGAADAAGDDVVAGAVCPSDPEVAAGETVAAAATPAPEEQITAAATPAVTTPRMYRAFGPAPRVPSSAPERAPSALPASADIRPPCLDHRT